MRKKLIEVALPLEAINKASAREKSIRHGHPSTLHLWWARRPQKVTTMKSNTFLSPTARNRTPVPGLFVGVLLAGYCQGRPFRREPDFGATSVNYSFSELLARSEDPA